MQGRELVAFDVPTDWTVRPPTTLVGFETSGGPLQVVVMHDVALLRAGCGTSGSRAGAGFVSADGGSPATLARDVATRWATVAGVRKDGTRSPVSRAAQSTVRLAGGSVSARVATVTLTVEEPGDCPAPSMTFTAVSFTAVSFTVGGVPVAFMLHADQEVGDALPTTVAARVISSLRPV